MTSYRFFKMAAIESKIYFRVQVYWRNLFKKVEIYSQAKFRCDISIHGWDKTTSGFGKRTAAISEFYIRFWRYIYFFKMAAGRHIGFDLGNVKPHAKCNCRCQLDSQIWCWSDLCFRDPIYSFGDIVIFIFCRFGWKLPIHVHFWEFWRHISPIYGHPSF